MKNKIFDYFETKFQTKIVNKLERNTSWTLKYYIQRNMTFNIVLIIQNITPYTVLSLI
jgi:hypothetical protein